MFVVLNANIESYPPILEVNNAVGPGFGDNLSLLVVFTFHPLHSSLWLGHIARVYLQLVWYGLNSDSNDASMLSLRAECQFTGRERGERVGAEDFHTDFQT